MKWSSNLSLAFRVEAPLTATLLTDRLEKDDFLFA